MVAAPDDGIGVMVEDCRDDGGDEYGYATDDVFYLEVCVYNQVCRNSSTTKRAFLAAPPLATVASSGDISCSPAALGSQEEPPREEACIQRLECRHQVGRSRPISPRLTTRQPRRAVHARGGRHVRVRLLGGALPRPAEDPHLAVARAQGRDAVHAARHRRMSCVAAGQTGVSCVAAGHVGEGKQGCMQEGRAR